MESNERRKVKQKKRSLAPALLRDCGKTAKLKLCFNLYIKSKKTNEKVNCNSIRHS